MALYDGETFAVHVIRRGWHFWTGRKFDLAPYTAKLFGTVTDARLTIASNHLVAADGDEVEIQQAKLCLAGHSDRNAVQK